MDELKKMQIEASYWLQNRDRMNNSSDDFIRGVMAGVEYAYNKLSIHITDEQRKALISVCEKFLAAEKSAYEEITQNQ